MKCCAQSYSVTTTCWLPSTACLPPPTHLAPASTSQVPARPEHLLAGQPISSEYRRRPRKCPRCVDLSSLASTVRGLSRSLVQYSAFGSTFCREHFTQFFYKRNIDCSSSCLNYLLPERRDFFAKLRRANKYEPLVAGGG